MGEIKQLNVVKHPLALNWIKEKQSNVVEVSLKPNMIGIISKLKPKYSGSFKIIKQSKKQNYVIADVSNTNYKRTVPLHKLKIIKNPLSDFNSTEILNEYHLEVNK